MAMLTKFPRPLIIVNNVLVWASAVIVMGITSWFVNKWNNIIGEHIIYEEVVAVVTVAVYSVVMFLPALSSYRGYVLPLNLVFSYLWLTSFIFSAQDYSWRDCRSTAPPTGGHCSKKWTVEAFNFIAFFFLFCNVVAEGYHLGVHKHHRHGPGETQKEPRLDTGSTAPPPAEPAGTGTAV